MTTKKKCSSRVKMKRLQLVLTQKNTLICTKLLRQMNQAENLSKKIRT